MFGTPADTGSLRTHGQFPISLQIRVHHAPRRGLLLLDPSWAPVTTEPVRTLLKTHPDGGYVLLVVNIDAAPQPVRIEFPDVKLMPNQLFETRGAARFQTDDAGFKLMAGPWAVHVIRLTP